ncbi:hypothetical protein B0H10DRAFT_1952323 [Mycena sp. CBHHK59/15]|nr:hypothetical protein B0H10DRAFT_1952323 [Mycena sp. CBHHK59/15]
MGDMERFRWCGPAAAGDWRMKLTTFGSPRSASTTRHKTVGPATRTLAPLPTGSLLPSNCETRLSVCALAEAGEGSIQAALAHGVRAGCGGVDELEWRCLVRVRRPHIKQFTLCEPPSTTGSPEIAHAEAAVPIDQARMLLEEVVARGGPAEMHSAITNLTGLRQTVTARRRLPASACTPPPSCRVSPCPDEVASAEALVE